MSAIDLLCEIIAQRTKVASAVLRLKSEYRPLLEHGYLREAGVVSSITCVDCDQPHDTEVVFDYGKYGYFCPDLGFVHCERADVQAVVADLPELIERLADTFDCKHRKATPLQDQTWRIGALETNHGSVMLYFHPLLRGEDDARALGDALSREVRSTWRLIITAEGALPIQGAETVYLRDLVGLAPLEGGLIAVADPRVLVGVPQKRTGGAPNRFESSVLDVIHDRIRNGQTLPGRNEEAHAVLNVFKEARTNEEAPSLPTIRRYVTKARSGS